ncbi:MAG: hypothetical protein KF893_24260, partial [Caldilineaceae bacterium]|nr:hypothetical protein [Caldilineaceae bacterium]
MSANALRVLQALHGDAFHIRFLGEDRKYHNIFVDGGFVKTYRTSLQKEVRQIINAGERIDLFVITHTDQDHISGVLAFIQEYGAIDLVDRYWFNHAGLEVMLRNPSDKISIQDGIKLRDYLKEKGKLVDFEITTDVSPENISGVRLTVLSPTKSDLDEFRRIWDSEEMLQRSKDKIAS